MGALPASAIDMRSTSGHMVDDCNFLRLLEAYARWAYDQSDLTHMTNDDVDAFIYGARQARQGFSIPPMVEAGVGSEEDSIVWWRRQGWIVVREGRLRWFAPLRKHIGTAAAHSVSN